MTETNGPKEGEPMSTAPSGDKPESPTESMERIADEITSEGGKKVDTIAVAGPGDPDGSITGSITKGLSEKESDSGVTVINPNKEPDDESTANEVTHEVHDMSLLEE